jgi:hypothetical protein
MAKNLREIQPPHDIELSEVKPLEKNEAVTPVKSKL